MLKGKNVLLGVTASIAAYKSAFLCRLLIKEGANVKVLMTPESTHFIGPLTLSTLSKNPVYTKYYNSDNGEWTNHVDLAKWADYMLIAPLTANTLGKMANGLCDNLLLATYLSMENPVFIAPAMDLDMYKDPTTLKNLEFLKTSGIKVIEAETGELASGLEGQGRMAEPENIIHFLQSFKGRFEGKTVLISAGPTYEKIDAVRFIGNRSSGKMGIALARAFKSEGANVRLVLGPSAQNTTDLDVISVESAEEMQKALHQEFNEADIVIMSAAVADYKIEQPKSNKLKKSESSLELKLTPTIDILKSLGDKKTHQFLIGFALETDDELENAKSKLIRKKLDLVVLNSLNDKGAGFSTDTNKVTLIDKNNNVKEFELKEKDLVAQDILEHTLSLIYA